MEEIEVVKIAKKGDVNAIEHILLENMNSMYRVAFSILRTEEEIADAISNTVVSTVFEEVEYAKNNSIDAKHIATTASKHLASSVVAGVIAGKEAKKLKTIADKRYSSENFQESISKEIKKEFRNQGKVMGNSTRKQFNIEVNNRIRNSKKATNSMIELRKNITNSTTEKITNKGIEKFIDR
jgi:hypothetical protein